MEYKVRVFTTPNCPQCKRLKGYLKEKGIPFEEVDVTQDEELTIEMCAKSGELSVPQVWIGDKVIIGFDKVKIDELLGLT